jgi:hypothetical protein
MCLSIPDFKQCKYENMNMINNINTATGINPSSNPTRPKETLFLNSPFSILHSLRFVLLCLFLPAISLSIGQVPGTPYGVQSLDCSAAPATPGNINLSTYVTAGTAFTASISAVTGAKSYEWVLADGLSGSSTGTSITVTAASTGTFAASAITVRAANDCGLSAIVQLAGGFTVYGAGTSSRYTGWCSSSQSYKSCNCSTGIGIAYNSATFDQRAAAEKGYDWWKDLSPGTDGFMRWMYDSDYDRYQWSGYSSSDIGQRPGLMCFE